MVSTGLAIPDNLLYQEKWVRFKYLAVIKNIWNYKIVFACVLFEKGDILNELAAFVDWVFLSIALPLQKEGSRSCMGFV